MDDRNGGGVNGGKTYLTEEGKIIVDAFNKLHLKLDDYIKDVLKESLFDINEQLKALNIRK